MRPSLPSSKACKYGAWSTLGWLQSLILQTWRTPTKFRSNSWGYNLHSTRNGILLLRSRWRKSRDEVWSLSLSNRNWPEMKDMRRLKFKGIFLTATTVWHVRIIQLQWYHWVHCFLNVFVEVPLGGRVPISYGSNSRISQKMRWMMNNPENQVDTKSTPYRWNEPKQIIVV